MSPCLIGMEACVGAHHLSRKLKALGHDARLMPAKYVRPYRNDIVVMDNCRVHLGTGIGRAIETVGATLRYLPKYSPDLNPIEMPYSGQSQERLAAGSRAREHFLTSKRIIGVLMRTRISSTF